MSKPRYHCPQYGKTTIIKSIKPRCSKCNSRLLVKPRPNTVRKVKVR